jgi:PIN domain nuclease of toxin-antitoxin system
MAHVAPRGLLTDVCAALCTCTTSASRIKRNSKELIEHNHNEIILSGVAAFGAE